MMTRLKKTIANFCIWNVITWIRIGMCMSPYLQKSMNFQVSFGFELIVVCYFMALPVLFAVYGIGFFLTECLMVKELEKSDIQTYRLLIDFSAIGAALIRFCWTDECKQSEANIDKFFSRHRALRLFDKRYVEN